MANTDIPALFAESLTNLKLTDKQKAVLEASLKLFSEKGFDNTSTSDIAKLAGVSEGTVYKQFKTKAGILKAIVEPFAENVIPLAATEFLDEVSTENLPDFKDFLTTVIKNRFQFAMNNLPQLRILFHEAITTPKISEKISKEILTLLSSNLKQAYLFYQTKGELVKWSPDRIFRYMISTVVGYVIPVLLIPGLTLDVDQVTKESTEFLLKGLSPK